MSGIRVMQRSGGTAAPRPRAGQGGGGGARAEAGRPAENDGGGGGSDASDEAGAGGKAAAAGGKGGSSSSVQGGGSGGMPAAPGAGAGGASGKGAAAGAGATAGAAAQSGAGAGGVTSTPAIDAIDKGPYFVSGAWHGYVWTALHGEGTTLAPLDFNAQTTGMPRCISGEVAATEDSSGSAMLGVNLNQDTPPDAPVLTVVPAKAGVRVSVTNRAGSPLRLQIQSLDGATNDLARWCAHVEGSGGFVAWSEFNTTCWDGAGRDYDGEPLSAAMILVPGTTDEPVPYDFCLKTLVEADGP